MAFADLLGLVDVSEPLVIQMHNFPDHDAVASAFGLQQLFEKKGIRSVICYGGLIQSSSLEEAVDRLGIPIVHCETLGAFKDPQIILVDGLVGNRNVTAIGGTLLGIIDHHQPSWLPDIPYRDIRSDYGSCSTIIYEYYREAGLEPERNTATALLMGIMMDTGFLTRGVSRSDLEAFSRLFFAGDWEMGSSLLKNSLSTKDLPVFQDAMDTHIIRENLCFIFLERDCSSELTAIVADFFLRLREVDFVVVVNFCDSEYKLSVRSENRKRPADIIVRKALSGIGSGGGHVFMGGGVVSREQYPGDREMMSRFLDAVKLVKGGPV